ncbi:MAG TPA: peptide-N-glycosidase F-related protein [Polyangiaceae bacterium]
MRFPFLAFALPAALVGGSVACGTSHDAGGSPGADAGDEAPAVDAGADATSDGTVPTDASEGGAEAEPGADATVSAFDKAHLFFQDGTAAGNQRIVTAQAAFPATGTYASIVLHVTLSCPTGGCDVYDRFGTIGVVTSPGVDGGANTVVEVARFITGFCAGGTWDYDVTDLRPLLTGNLTMEAFIDTWVPQGQSGIGQGWLLTASFEMTGGTPPKVPVAVVPLWPGTPVAQAWYGDPATPIASSIPPQTVTLPAGASSYALRSFVTGHGQGNADNCSEFCSRTHTLTVGSTANTATVWRTDCASTPNVKSQCGTATDSRAGWCPGADVKPWVVDVTGQVGAGPTTTIAYDVAGYTDTSCGCNTCRPGAVPDGGTCAGCVFSGTTCSYDGSLHTQPFYYVSSALIAYE